LWIVLGIIAIPLTVLTLGAGALFMLLAGGVIYLAALFIWIWLMYKAYNGEKYKLPVAGNIAEKYAKR